MIDIIGDDGKPITASIFGEHTQFPEEPEENCAECGNELDEDGFCTPCSKDGAKHE